MAPSEAAEGLASLIGGGIGSSSASAGGGQPCEGGYVGRQGGLKAVQGFVFSQLHSLPSDAKLQAQQHQLGMLLQVRARGLCRYFLL